MEESGNTTLGIIMWIIIGIAILAACGIVSLTLAGLATLLAL